MKICLFQVKFINDLRLLGVPTNATQDEVEHAFRVAAKKHHPDKNIGNEEVAAEKMKNLLDARGRLGEYFSNNSQLPTSITNSEQNHSPVFMQESQNLDKHYSTTSREYLNHVCSRTGRPDPSDIQMCFEENIPLDEEWTFHAFYPFLSPSLECNPYAFAENMSNAKDRYLLLFTSLDRAKEHLSKGAAMSFMGGKDAVYMDLKNHGYMSNGIIYSFRGCPRVIIECFARGGIDNLVPLITGYHTQQLYRLSDKQKALFQEIEPQSTEDLYYGSPTTRQLLREIRKTRYPKLPVISKEVPTEVVMAYLEKKPAPQDYSCLSVAAESSPSTTIVKPVPSDDAPIAKKASSSGTSISSSGGHHNGVANLLISLSNLFSNFRSAPAATPEKTTIVPSKQNQ